MCTAVSFVTKDFYFGRNLDYEFSYEESVTITPRNYYLSFRNGKVIKNHYAMIGVAYVVNDYPLYYDAVNEAGLGMAGLLFEGNAVYMEEEQEKKDSVASYEFIPWILSQCKNVEEAEQLLRRLCIMNWEFSKELPPSPLHWMIADKRKSIVVEMLLDGINVYDNPVHVLTNNPPFKYQLMNLNNYMGISAEEPGNFFSHKIQLTAYSRGMGSLGLPGDSSSASRFVRSAFTGLNSVCGEVEDESISQFFHILGSVEQIRGCVRINCEEDKSAKNVWENEKYEITIYSCCCNADRGIYYYKTYDSHQIMAVDMNREELDGFDLKSYPLVKNQQIRYQN